MAREATVEIAYVPFKSFLGALDTLRQGIPEPLDRTVFQSQSGSTQAMLISTFKALGAIDDENRPQPILKRLVEPETRKAALKEVLDDKYASVMSLGQNASQKQFDDAFYAYGVNGATHQKAKSFFLQAAEMLGITLSPHIATAGKSSGVSPKAAGPRKPRKRKLPSGEGGGDDGVGRGSRADLPPVIAAWIDEMPPAGEEWSREDFDSWLNLFAGSIERLYKISPRKKDSAAN